MMKPVYANLIGTSVLPIILIILTIAIWSLIKCCRKSMSKTDYFQYVKGTIINILFILHPTILKTTMQIFTCTKIDDKKYLDIYMDDECWNGDH